MLLLLIAFILSGAAGLIYESIWGRYLGLFVGHSAYAQLIVLVIFMGGMSLGAWIAGERSTRIRYPLRAYAIVELVAGLLGFAFHSIFVGVTDLSYDSIFPGLAGSGMLTVVKWTLAGLLILPQSILLGTTFPLMTAGAIRLATHAPGRTLSLMYFANSLGAAGGVLFAGFFLLAWGGLPGTLDAAAAINFLVAGMVFIGARLLGWDDTFARIQPEEPAPTPTPAAASTERAVTRLLLIVAFGTAVASFIYEIAWIRMLSLVLGSATHSFELMLSAFIFGLAIGAFVVRRYADRFEHPVRALAIVQIAMGTLALATLPVYLWTFEWIAALQGSLARTDGGYGIYAVARYVLCILVMFPATVCAGMTLPLITRTLFKTGAGERAIGRVYSVNTLGSIVGIALAGLVLMPLIGVKWLLVTGALADVALGVVLLVWAWERTPFRHPGIARGALVATGVFIFAIVAFTRLDASVLSSGVFRYGSVPDAGSNIIHYHVDGRTATVTVKQNRAGSGYSLLTNGKPDASIPAEWLEPAPANVRRIPLPGDMSTQVLLALSTLAHAPQAEVAAVIGQGSGITSHFMLASPALSHLSTIEIEPEMIEASKRFQPFNRRVFEDPRSHFVIDDAKSYFAAGHRKYDVILSEPSNPWVSGVSGLFTDEFYRRVRAHLTDDGVFGQWIHLYEIDDRLVLSVLAAIDRNFADYALYTTGGADILVVARPEGRLQQPDWEAVLAWPSLDKDLPYTIPLTPAALERTFIAGRDLLHPYLMVDVEPNSDYEPVLDLGAERTRYLGRSADGLMSLGTHRFDLARALSGDTLGFADYAMPLGAARVRGMARSSELRAERAGRAPADTLPDEARDRLRYRAALLDAAMASPRPPVSWRAWWDLIADVEQGLHLGSAGVADEVFWPRVLAYVERHGAPAEVRAAADLLYGAAAWDWDRVLAAAPALEAAQRANRPWVNADLLRDAVVAAHLRKGNAAAAREALGRLTVPAGTATAVHDFRTRVLFWYVANAAGLLDQDRLNGTDEPNVPIGPTASGMK